MGTLGNGLKVQSQHLARKAVVYVRQSTVAQERRNTGSKARQYDLVGLALELGWAREDVIVVDQDQATSASSLSGREAFQWVLAEVALRRVGGIFCLMVDRLSRSDFDWPHIFKICQVTDTLIIDDDRAWDLNDHDDLTMLGIKGAISASESRLIRSRCQGGALRKARAGDLKFRPPTGFVRDECGRIVLDPDERVRQAVSSFFELFDALPSAGAVVTYFKEHEMQFPTRVWGTDLHGELTWGPLLLSRVYSVLHNPAYAGAYVWGRTRVVAQLCPKNLSETKSIPARLPMDEWQVMRSNDYAGYISWERYLRNLERLRDNATSSRKGGSPGAVKRGAALLTGILMCGKCGRRMHTNHGARASYVCAGDRDRGAPHCQSMQAWYVDPAVADSLLEAINPAQLRMTLRAVERVEGQRRHVIEQWDLRLEHARYEAERVRRHLIKAEPEYELVTRTLRREWEDKLRAVKDIERQRDLAASSSPPALNPAERRAVVQIAKDLPRLWRADTTTSVERKQFLRFLIKDVSIFREGRMANIAIRWQTGALSRLEVPVPHRRDKLRSDPELIALIRRLAVDHTNQMIAEYLNNVGWKSRRGKRFTKAIVQQLRYNYKIPNSCPALSPEVSFEPRGDGRIGTKAAERLLNVNASTIADWCREGRLDCTRGAHRSPLWIKLDEEQIRRLRRPLRRGHTAPPPHIESASAQAIKDDLVSDAVWNAVSRLMPPEPVEISGGRPRISNRALLCAVVFVLRHEITWWDLPVALGCGCGANCRRRLLLWLKAGTWQPVQEALTKLLPDGARLDWRRTLS